jgi:hypothetical protein
VNINGFIDGFRGGARKNNFEVWIQYPSSILETVSANIIQSTAQASIPSNANLPEYVTNSSTAQRMLENTTGAGTRLVVKSAKLPASKRTTLELQYKGRKIPFPGTVEDDTNMSFTFYNDIHFFHRNALQIWSQNIRTTQTNIGRYPNELYGTIKIFQHDQMGNVLKIAKLVNAFPSEVGEIALDWDSEDIETFDASFNYQYFVDDMSDTI